MSEISTETKPSEALEVEVLFPCECGNTDDYQIRLIAYSRAGFDLDRLGSNMGTGGYDDIEIDASNGVACMGCDIFYKVGEAEKACVAYRSYLGIKEEGDNDKTGAAWRRFVEIRDTAIMRRKKS